MERLVWMDAWQHDCCGTAFAVGDTVTWRTYETFDRDGLVALVGEETAAALTDSEERHEPGAALSEVTGTVAAIDYVTAELLPPVNGVRAPAPGTGRLDPIERADDLLPDPVEDERFAYGLVVRLVDATVRPPRPPG